MEKMIIGILAGVGLVTIIGSIYNEWSRRKRVYKACHTLHLATLDLMKELGCSEDLILKMKDSYVKESFEKPLEEFVTSVVKVYDDITEVRNRYVTTVNSEILR